MLGEKIEIALDGGQTKRVRAKDVVLLHPGPIRSLSELAAPEGDPDEAHALLEGGETNLKELAELAFGEFSPSTAWAAWQLVADGLGFAGEPDAIQVRSRADMDREREARHAKVAAEADWKAFIARVEGAALQGDDRQRMIEVERVALGKAEHSRILAALKLDQTPESAHRALIACGYWTPRFNPYPLRCGVSIDDPIASVPDLEAEERLDLTALAAYAVDDEGNEDPDDALSIDDDAIWVHIADVAALVAADGEIEREARSRGANLYAPEGVVNMLPPSITERLGLGLQEVSPALSIRLRLDEQAEPVEVEVHRSWIRARRMTYTEVEDLLDAPPFRELGLLADRFRARREAAGATRLDLPEVSVRVVDGEVRIRPLARLASRALVAEAMLMAGEGIARLCHSREIPIPYATQAPADGPRDGVGLAADYGRRRGFKPTRMVGAPDVHAGLGLPMYTRVTSPLRRYPDLLVHQQLRAWLAGETLLTPEQVTERVGESELSAAAIRRAERLSNLHWKLVYLKEHPQWRGEAVIVAKEERRVVALIPELALETRLRVKDDPGLDAKRTVLVGEVDLPGQSVSFRPAS
jgi:exoribonuclease-2